MPGTITAGVPDAVPLQVVQQASGSSTNGEASSASEDTSSAGGLKCNECGQLSKAVRACGGCWQTWYCSRAHQVKDWPKHKVACRPYKVSFDQRQGRFLVATRDIKPGELLIEDPVLIMGPKTITEPVCLACYRPVNGDYTCSDCGFPLCDEDCYGSEAHQPECKAVQDSGIKVKVSVFGETNSMYECIMPLRILALRDSNTSVWRKVMSLENHAEKRGGTEIAAITQKTVVDIILNRLNMDYETEVINQVLGMIDTNAFEIRLPDSSIMGVYAVAALLEHNCIPNTHRTFDADLNLVVRAAIDIKRGDHLHFCYTEALSTTVTRQEHLISSKFFTCTCDRCKDPTELGTYASAMLCPACTKEGKPVKEQQSENKGGTASKKPNEVETFGVVLQTDPSSLSSTWACLTCNAPLDSDFVTRMTAVMTEEAEELENGSHNIESCEAFLEKWEPTYHRNHSSFLNIKYILIHLYGSEAGYSLEEMTPIQLLRKENLARQILKVADVLVPGISRLRGSVLYELYQSIFYKTCSMFQSGVIPNEIAKRMAKEAYDCLLECARVLSYEPPVQPEGQLGLEAKEELRQMIKWMKEEGWKG